MRVCHVTPHLPPEQAANAILPVQLAQALAAAGVQSTFVSHFSERFGAAGAPAGVAIAPRRGRSWIARSPVGAAVAAAAMGRVAKPRLAGADVVHLHSNGQLVEVAAATARRLGCPSIITLYGTDVWDHDPRRHARFRHAVQQATTRVFYSQALREFAEPLGLAPSPSVVLYAPVDDVFTRVDAAGRQALRESLGVATHRVVLTVKRLHAVAGYDVAIAAFASIAREYPDAIWIIAGYGDLRPALEAEVQARGLTSRVRFLGLTPQDQLPRWYAAADLFLLASRLESWGAVTIEALACGTPVVATATAGTREIRDLFPHDVTVVPVGDAAALASIASLVLATGRRATDASARRIDDAFRLPAAARAYLALYERAAGRRAGAAPRKAL